MFTIIALLIRLREGQTSNAPVAQAAQSNRRLTLSRARTLASSLLLLGLVAFLVWSPALIPILHTFFSADYDLEGWGDALMLSADLLGWFTATVFHPIFGGDVVREMRLVQQRAINPELTGFRDINTVFLGWATLALALVGALAHWRRVKIWVWTALVFGVLTLGPLLQINGRYRFDLDGLETTVPLPFLLLHFIPIVKANRAPNRNSVLLMLGLAVLVGYGLYWLLDQARRRRLTMNVAWLRPTVAIALTAAILFEHLALPLPLTDARIPAVYETIAAEPGEFSILQLPLGWRNSFGTLGAEETRLQYYQSYHQKRLLAGNISRAPAFKFEYFKRIPLFRAITEVEMYRTPDQDTIVRAQAQAGELLTLYDIRYLIVHDAIPLRYPYVDTAGPTRELALALLPHEPTPFACAGGTCVYRLIQPSLPNPLRIELGEWRSFPYRGEGWGDDEEVFGAQANWVIGSEAHLFFPVRGAGDRRLALRIAPFAYPGAAQQTLTLTLNGRPIGKSLELGEGWQIVSLRVPHSVLRQGLNVLTLHFAHAVAPVAVLDIPDDRPLAAAVDWLEISEER
jgi:hypothetical protein